MESYSGYIHPLISRQFGMNPLGLSGSDELIYHCPFCESAGKGVDRKGKLYVNNRSLKYHCFRCGSSGKLNYNESGLNINTGKSKDAMVEDLEKYVASTYSHYSRTRELQIYFEYEIPCNRPIPGSAEFTYLLNRGLTPTLIKYYDIRVASIVSRYANRVIIPNRVYHVDDFIDLTDMFVARYIYDIPEGSSEIQRYLNPYGKNRSNVVFNLHRIKENSPIILTEGCFTAIAAGFNAVACYGKLVTNNQLQQILNKKPSKLYLNLDPDAYTEMIKLAYRIRRCNKDLPIYIVRFKRADGDHIDASDLGREKYLYYLKHAVKFNSEELKVLDVLGKDHKYLDCFLES